MSHFYLMYGNVLRKLYHSYAYFTIAIEYCKALGLCSALIAIVQKGVYILLYMYNTGVAVSYCCLLYTSDAADDMQCVDLGGRRIIKKNQTSWCAHH